MNQEHTSQPSPNQEPVQQAPAISRRAKIAMGAALVTASAIGAAAEYGTSPDNLNEAAAHEVAIDTPDDQAFDYIGGADTKENDPIREPSEIAAAESETPEEAPAPAPAPTAPKHAQDKTEHTIATPPTTVTEMPANQPVEPKAEPEAPGEAEEPPMEVEITGVEAGQEYMSTITADLTEHSRAENIMYIHGAQFNVSEDYQEQYGITTIFHPIVTGKDTFGYLRVNPETGVVEGGVIDARHGVVQTAQGQADENRWTTLLKQHVDNEPYNKGGMEDYYQIVADDENQTFVGQATGTSSRKGGGDDTEDQPLKGGGDDTVTEDTAVKGGSEEEYANKGGDTTV